jgi:trimeric autotransporter adhesin
MKQWIGVLLVAAALGGCGGGDGGSDGSGDSSGSTPPPPVTVTIGGSVTGLTGTLALRNNGANDLTLSRDGAFTFSTALGSGVAYDVTIATQPANQTCVVTKGSGITTSSNVTDVSVTCTGGAVTPPSGLSYPSPQNYTVGVAIAPINPTVTGSVTSFSVSPALPAGLSLDSSTGQISGTPSVASAATDYSITATNGGGSTTFTLAIAVNIPQSAFTVGATITGLSGTGLVLRNNNGDDLKVTANGAVTFSSALASGAAYFVTVEIQPVRPGQLCSVTNGAGTVANANVTDVAITCVGASFIDTDRDGLTDEIETILGTDPTKVDSDGDGLADGEEVLLRRTDPLQTDTDADGATDNA